MMSLDTEWLKLPSIFLTVFLVFGKWIYTRGTQLFAHYLLPGVYGATLTVLQYVGVLVYHFVCTVISMCGEWIYVILKILICTVPQTVTAFLGIFEALVHTSLLAVLPLLTATARTLQSIAHLYTSSDSLGGWVKHMYNSTIELCFHGVEYKINAVQALLMVSWHLVVQLFHTACTLLVVTVTTLVSIVTSLLYLVAASLVSVAMTCAGYLATLLTWLGLGLKILAVMMDHILLLVNLIWINRLNIYSGMWNFLKFLLAIPRDFLYAIFQFAYTLGKITYFTSVAFVKDTVHLIYRLFGFLLYDVLPWILQFINDLTWTVARWLWEYRVAVGVPLLLLIVIVVTVWLTRVADSAKSRRNAQSTGVHCNTCMTPWCMKQRCKRPIRGAPASIQLAGPLETSVIEGKFQSKWAPGKGACPKIKLVFVIQNDKLEQRWMTYRQTLPVHGVEEHYHGTNLNCNIATNQALCQDAMCGVCGIARRGFKKSRMRPERFQRFGGGFYLAPNSSKSYEYPLNHAAHNKAMLLCYVCPGRKYYLTKNSTSLTKPPPGYDSVYGQTGYNLNYEEIVLYEEHSILPCYILVYR